MKFQTRGGDMAMKIAPSTFKIILIVFFTTFIFTSCVLPDHLQMYSGASRSKDQVAFLKEGDGGLFASFPVKILSVNGKEVKHSMWTESIVDLLPGDHIIIAAYWSGSNPQVYSSALTFKLRVEAGHTYIIRPNRIGYTWNPTIEDISIKK
jgi:hypothetical protein